MNKKAVSQFLKILLFLTKYESHCKKIYGIKVQLIMYTLIV